MARDLTNDDVEQLRAVFAVFDKDNDGQITVEELGAVMQSLGQTPTETELHDMVNEIDSDNSGSVDFDEFLEMMVRKRPESDINGELRAAFRVFDKSNTGSISFSELRQVMESIGEHLSTHELEAMMKEADKDGDGTIDYYEFVDIVMAK